MTRHVEPPQGRRVIVQEIWGINPPGHPASKAELLSPDELAMLIFRRDLYRKKLQHRYDIKLFRERFHRDMAVFEAQLAHLRELEAQRQRTIQRRFDPAQPRDANGRWTDGGGVQTPTQEDVGQLVEMTRRQGGRRPPPSPPPAATNAPRRGIGDNSGEKPPRIVPPFIPPVTGGTGSSDQLDEMAHDLARTHLEEMNRVAEDLGLSPRPIDPAGSSSAQEATRALQDAASELQGRIDAVNLAAIEATGRPAYVPPSTAEIVTPGGAPVGVQWGKAWDHQRTVSPSEFDRLQGQLMMGATPVPGWDGMKGYSFRRSSGEEFSRRDSKVHGRTLNFKEPDLGVTKIHENELLEKKMVLDLGSVLKVKPQPVTLADYIDQSAGFLELDITALRELTAEGRRIGFAGADLIEFVRRCIYAHYDAGARPCAFADGGTYRPLPEFGTGREEIADNLIRYWQDFEREHGAEAFNGAWYVLLGLESFWA